MIEQEDYEGAYSYVIWGRVDYPPYDTLAEDEIPAKSKVMGKVNETKLDLHFRTILKQIGWQNEYHFLLEKAHILLT